MHVLYTALPVVYIAKVLKVLHHLYDVEEWRALTTMSSTVSW